MEEKKTERMYENACTFFSNKIDNEPLNFKDFDSLFLPIQKAISDESRKNFVTLNTLKNPLSQVKNNTISLRTKTNSNFSTISNKAKKKIQSSVQPQVIVNSDGSFKRVNGKSTQDNYNLKMKNELLMNILSKKSNSNINSNSSNINPPQFQMKKNPSSNTLNKEIEINNDVLPSKTIQKFKIESIDLSYRPEENKKKKIY
jgi:hypothetical protein